MINTDLIKLLPSVNEITGELPNQLKNISTDSRSYISGDIFVALVGENFDGSKYLSQVHNDGAKILVCCDNKSNREICNSLSEVTVIFVKDTIQFVQELANAHIKDWQSERPHQRKIIAITGSNGKTTNKEMLFHLIESIRPGKVLCTYKNLNNHLGVPFTIFKIDNEIDYAIIEMGTNHPGEIKALCDIAVPNMGMITNIGAAHLEFLKDLEGVFKEKRNLFDGVMANTNSNGVFVVNCDDLYLKNLDGGTNLIKFGKEKNSNLIYSWNNNQISFKLNDKKIILKNENILGEHNFSNLLACFLMASQVFPNEIDKLIAACESFSAKDNRSLWIKYENKKIFLDAYNANPSSMHASLKAFMDYIKQNNIDQQDCLIILGDMNELGDQTDMFHAEIGNLAKLLGALNPIFIGRYSQFYKNGFKADCLALETIEEFKNDYWSQLIKFKKYIFIKGSRSLQLESLIQ